MIINSYTPDPQTPLKLGFQIELHLQDLLYQVDQTTMLFSVTELVHILPLHYQEEMKEEMWHYISLPPSELLKAEWSLSTKYLAEKD